MEKNNRVERAVNGGCLCGKVRYQLTGNCRHVVNCHCENCRRTHGHFAAYTSVDKSDLVLRKEESLKWYHDKSPDTYRGFCDACGASLFWDRGSRHSQMAVAAGTLDAGHGLKTIGHIFMSEAGEYYQVEDGLPKFETSSNGELDQRVPGNQSPG